MARTFCQQCGHEIQEWENGNCQVCSRIEDDHKKFGGSSSPHGHSVITPLNNQPNNPPNPSLPSSSSTKAQSLTECLQGTWICNRQLKNRIFFDFIHKRYRFIKQKITKELQLALVSENGNAAIVNIGGHRIFAMIQQDGYLQLSDQHGYKEVFHSNNNGRLCPKCLRWNDNKSSCQHCEHSFIKIR